MQRIILACALALSTAVSSAQTTETRAIVQLRQGGVDLAHQRNIMGQGIRIGIVDQGFDLSHRDFTGRILATRNFNSGTTVTWGTHGTAMASVAAANANNTGTVGVAPMATLLLAQAGSGGTNTVMSESAVYRAIDWLSANRADIINLSLGATYDTKFTQTTQRNTTTGIYFAAAGYGANYGAASTVINNYKLATDRGSIIVASAGNQGLGYSAFPGMYATRTDANNRLVLGGRMIIVGAVDANNVMASFSNRPGHICQNSVGLTCRDTYLTRDFYVVAPGVNVVVSQANQLGLGQNLATTMSGTSPAAAYVSGGMALIKQTWPQLRAEQLVALVLTTTRDLGAPGTDNVYGRGLVDFDRATQPQGRLTVASKIIEQPGAALSATGTAMTHGVAQIFRTSSVLQRVQVLDSYQRNYTADLGRAIVAHNMVTYSPDSPWLGIAGYQQLRVPVTDRIDLRVLAAHSGAGSELLYQLGTTKLAAQAGSVTEARGFLGNSGSGGLGLGSSMTNWIQFGIEQAVTDQTSAIAQFGLGLTQVTNDPMSMIQVLGPVRSRSWRLGVARDHNLAYQDRVTVSVASPVNIQSGQARVTAVTGYNYNDLENGTTEMTPIVESQTVNLRGAVPELNLVLSYQHMLTKSGLIRYNLIQRYRAGSQPGLNDTYMGVNLTWMQ